MGRLTERELTRLSYLMAAFVASPQLSERLIDQEASATESQPWLRDLLRYIGGCISDLATGKTPTWATLRRVASGLMRESDVEKQTVGRLLTAALESAPIEAES